MKLFKVYNGYTADSAVFVIVVAADEERAKEVASAAFKEDARNKNYRRDLKRAIKYRMKVRPRKHHYREGYWKDLEAELVSDDLTVESVSEIIE